VDWRQWERFSYLSRSAHAAYWRPRFGGLAAGCLAIDPGTVRRLKAKLEAPLLLFCGEHTWQI